MPKTTYGPRTGSAVREQAAADAYAARAIEMLQAGTMPWQVKWDPADGQPHGGMPYNAASGKLYSGANLTWLATEQLLRGYSDSRWLTYKQAQALGANVRRGERGTQIVKYVERASASQDKQEEGDDAEAGRGKALMPIRFTVFNAEQIDGLAPAPVREMPAEFERHEKCEQLMKDAGVLIEHNGGNQAFYRPSTDSVHLPTREQFHSADAYYAVALHELGHASGHPTRLDRDLTGKFGSEKYAREELRAEIASWMAGDRLGIGHDPGHHASYVAHWVKVLQDDPKEILRACSDAEKICQHLGVEKYEHAPTLKAEQSAEQTAERSNVVAMPTRTPSEDWAPGDKAAKEVARVADKPRTREREYSMGL